MISGPDENVLQLDAMSSAAATMTVSHDKFIVGAMRAALPNFWRNILSKVLEGVTNTITKKRYDDIVQNMR